MRTTALSVILASCVVAALIGAEQPGSATLCDALASRIQGRGPAAAGTGAIWSLLTTGATPAIEVATVSELSLDRDPADDERVQFEKRFRALYGNAEAVLKELRTW